MEYQTNAVIDKHTLTVLSASGGRNQLTLIGRSMERHTRRAEKPLFRNGILHGENASLMTFQSRFFRIQIAVPNLYNESFITTPTHSGEYKVPGCLLTASHQRYTIQLQPNRG